MPKNPHEKAMQRALIQYRDPKNYDLVEGSSAKGRADGSDRFRCQHCLIPPRKMEHRRTIRVTREIPDPKTGAVEVRNGAGRQAVELKGGIVFVIYIEKSALRGCFRY